RPVPSRLTAAVGRLRYGEPFWPAPIRSRVVDGPGEVRAEYGVGPAALGWHVNVTGARAVLVPPPDSSEHYSIERGFACRARPDRGLGMFRGVHPAWAVRQVLAVDYRFDFGSLYAAEWEFLTRARPPSVVFAVGSEVACCAPTAPTGTCPAASLVMLEKPRQRVPRALGAITAGAVGVPAGAARIRGSMRRAAGVSNDGPSRPAETPSSSGMRFVRATSRARRRSAGS